MAPKYFFRIDDMDEDPGVTPIPDPRGIWTPHTTAGSNRLVGGGLSGRYWGCNGSSFVPIEGLPHGSVPFRTYSFYFDQGFWVSDSDASHPTEPANAWRRLSFDHFDDFSTGLTYAGQQNRLRTQRENQVWPHKLLPSIYHAAPGTWAHNSLHYGGLSGELPIVLALIAFSTSRERAYYVINSCFVNERFRPEVHADANGSGWEDRRGMVVRVWTYPDPRKSNDEIHQELEDFENGVWRNYFD